MQDLERRVRLAKANVETIMVVMSTWNETPLYQRKEDKNVSLLNLDVSVGWMEWVRGKVARH